MLKGIVGIILFMLIAIAVVAALILRFMYKGVRNIKEIQEEFINTGGKKMNRQEYIRYQKAQREKNPFDKDYFKGAEGSSKKKRESEKKATSRRTTTTDSGVTIIDDREADEKKIFEQNDGEYVEFEEV